MAGGIFCLLAAKPSAHGMPHVFGGTLAGINSGLGAATTRRAFLTHTLWSAWIASLLILILAQLILSKGAVTSCAEAQAQKFRN